MCRARECWPTLDYYEALRPCIVHLVRRLLATDESEDFVQPDRARPIATIGRAVDIGGGTEQGFRTLCTLFRISARHGPFWRDKLSA